MRLNDKQRTALDQVMTILGSSPITVIPDLTVLKADGAPVGKEDRKELIEMSIAGKHIELSFPAQVYAQGDEPNLKFVRIKDSRMKAAAKTAKGQPFLRDHATHNQEKRGGTILRSVAEKRGDLWTVQQEIRANEPWSVRGLLTGNIDRFSVGIRSMGPIQYRHSKETIEPWPRHWPGSTIEVDGKKLRVEWVYTDARLTETSAVNAPAVLQTGVTDEIRALLSDAEASLPVQFAGGISPEPDPVSTSTETKEGTHMDPKVLKNLLGLSDDTGEAEIVAAVKSLQLSNAQNEAAAAAAFEQRLNRDIADAIKDGRLSIERDDAGKVVQSRTEKAMRKLAALDYASFTETLGDLPKVGTPVAERTAQGKGNAPTVDPIPAIEAASAPSLTVGEHEAAVAELAAQNPHLAAQAEHRGITVEEMLKKAKLSDPSVSIPLALVK